MKYQDPIRYNLPLGNPYGISAYAIWTDAIKVAGHQGEIFLVTGSRSGYALDVSEPTPVMFFGMESGQLVDLSKKINFDSAATVITRNLLLADFNGDGLTDIFLGNHGTEKFTPLPGEQNRLMLQRSDGTLVDATKNLPTLTDFTHGPDYGDLNGDGKLDIFVNNLGDDDSNASYILSNDGAAKFTYLADTNLHKNGVFDTGLSNYVSSPLSLIVDVDGDGQNDIFCGAFSKWDESSKTLIDFGAGYLKNDHGSFKITFDSDLNFPANSSSVFAYRKADFNQDGREDVLVAGAQPNGQLLLQLYYSGTNGLKNASTTALDLNQISKLVVNGGIDLQVVDIDGDGTADFEVRGSSENFTSEVRYTFFNQGVGNFASPLKNLAGIAAARGSYVDLNGDGIKDFVHQVGEGLEVLFAKSSTIITAPTDNQHASQAYRIYQAAFNRTPDNGGLKYWIGLMDSGVSLTTVSSAFIASAEFQKLYGDNPTNELFVTKLYDNVLHRAPDAGGYNYWVSLLNSGGIDKVNTLVNFSESAENQAGVIGVIQNGIDLFS